MAEKTLKVTAAQIEESVEKSHNHSNLSTLNNITSSRMSEWDDKADKEHRHNASEIDGLDNLDVDLSNYYTKTQVDNKIATEIDSIGLSSYAKKTEIPNATSDLTNDSNFATQSFVTSKIAEASLSGGNVDLSGYATKDELNTKANISSIPTKTSQLTNDSNYLVSVPSEYVTETELETELNNKVDKVSGYSLVSDTEIDRLANVDNYDDTEVRGLIPTKVSQLENDSNYLTSIPSEYVTETELQTSLDSKVDKVSGKGLSTNDLTNELVTKINNAATQAYVTNAIAEAQLDGSDVDLSGLATKDELNEKAPLTHSHNISDVSDLQTALDSKVDAVSGKSLISNAEIVRLASVDNYDDTEIRGLIPTKVSQLLNDSNYLTSIPSEYITETELNDKGYATTAEVDQKIANGTVDLSGYALKTEVPTKTSQLTNDSNYLTSIPEDYVTETELNTSLSTKVDKVSGYSLVSDTEIARLANVDNYDDSEIRGLIPTKISQLTNDSNYLTSIPSEYVTETELNDKGYATKEYVDGEIDNISIPTKLSELQNDTNFIVDGDEINATFLNGKKFSEPMTKEEYEALADKEPNTIYLVDDDTAITGVPNYSSSDAGKVLAVNSTGTGLVWVTLSSSGGGSEEPKTLNSISAVYNQGSTVVYPSTGLDSLKNNLTVTATYSDNSTSVITSDYSLSGNLTVGTSTITVTYNDETTTFNVNVSEPIPVDGIVSNPIFYVDARYGQSTSALAWDNMGTATMPTTTTQGPSTENHPERGFINGALVDIDGQYNFTWSGLPALNDFTVELNCKLGSRGTAGGLLLDSAIDTFDIHQKEDDTIYNIWVGGKQYDLARTLNDKDCIQIRRRGATVEIFKDGELATTITDAHASATKATQLKISTFVGEVYSCILYDRVLTDEELQQNRDYEASLNRGVD